MPVAPPHIRNLLFDLGNVLVHLDYRAALADMAARCRPPPGAPPPDTSFPAFFQHDPVLDAYERGRASRTELFRHFARLTGYGGTEAEFTASWRSVLHLDRRMTAFARGLADRYGVYFLSNAGEMHVPYVYERYPELRFFNGEAISYQLGARKPERAFYEKALARFTLAADTCLFIDDRAENIAGAEACGIRAILCDTTENAMRAITEALA